MKFFSAIYAPLRQYEQEFANCALPEPNPQSANDGDHHHEGGGDDDSVRTIQAINEKDQRFVVSFDNTPQANPRKWSKWKKSKMVLDIVMLAFQLTFASAISSTAVEGQMKSLNIDLEVSQISTAIFLLGFGVGGIPFGPLSEALGRQSLYTSTLFASTCFEIGAATSANIWTLIICRFFAGFFGATPLSSVGGSLMDIYNPIDRASVFPVFAGAAFLGPAGAPVIGGYLAMNYHITYISGFALTLYVFLTTPETLGNEILRQKARIFRRRTGDERWRAPQESVPLKQIYTASMTKVFKLLCTEPLVMFSTAYLSIVYTVLFGFLEAYPVIFSAGNGYNHLNLGETGLAFIPINIGILCAIVAMIPFGHRYKRKAIARGMDSAPPEEHYLPMMVGGVVLPVSVFWIGWTSFKSISVWAPMMAGVPFGFSVLLIFIATYQNIIESYGPNASSALGALVLVRYSFAAGAVMFVHYTSVYKVAALDQPYAKEVHMPSKIKCYDCSARHLSNVLSFSMENLSRDRALAAEIPL
ncbi:MAG: hypothetical protein CYPHOPRED_002357 [Cyphobasidiales sp. Tagirdzhanova-0007]|nr:MAG: hypothetical protein CYPHOPRED_002357 [Cyphobasidiales sp. Tagirdzhanova-0007]